MSQHKWKFLEPYIEALKMVEPDITNQEIARRAIERFSLNLDTEQARKVVSRIVNSSELQEISVETDEVKIGERWEAEEVNPILEKKETKIEELITGPGVPLKIDRPGAYLVLGCVHAPFHNKAIMDGIGRLMGDTKFDGLIINGDFVDCNSLSGHDKGKFTVVPGLNLRTEYAEGKKLLDSLTNELPKDAVKVYLYGNHEDRYWRFLADMQQAKTPPASPTEGLGLAEKGFAVLDNYNTHYMTLGRHLDIMHGVYYNEHCAKKHIDRFRSSVLFAHTHRIQTFVEGKVGGFNTGWLGDADHKAFNFADRGMKACWQNGFAIVTIDEHGAYYVEQIFCHNNKFYRNNKCYR
jgi:predicted phosphodiesterase